jgi:hypothetical protein
MGETRQERRMRQGREAVAADRKRQAAAEGPIEVAVDQEPEGHKARAAADASFLAAAEPGVPMREDDGDPHEVRTTQHYLEAGGPIGFTGDKATREMKLAVKGTLGRAVYSAIWDSTVPMTAENIWKAPLIRMQVEDRHPFMRDASLAKVQEQCRRLATTGWVIRSEGDLERYEPVRPKPTIDESEAFNEILTLVDRSACGKELRPLITELLCRVDRKVDPRSPRAAAALAEVDASWPRCPR